MSDINNEEWRRVPIAELSHLYEVSASGRIRRSETGRILKDGRSGHWGHRKVNLYLSGTPQTHLIHRLVALAFLGEAPTPGHEVAHNNGNPADNQLKNLRWATHAENLADKKIHGTETWGERNSNAKLIADDVIKIRNLHSTGSIGYRKLADQYGVTAATIRDIIVRNTWTHVL